MSQPPATVEECDRELLEYRKAMRLVSLPGRVAVWEQIDRILEIRFLLQTTAKKQRARVRQSQR